MGIADPGPPPSVDKLRDWQEWRKGGKVPGGRSRTKVMLELLPGSLWAINCPSVAWGSTSWGPTSGASSTHHRQPQGGWREGRVQPHRKARSSSRSAPSAPPVPTWLAQSTHYGALRPLNTLGDTSSVVRDKRQEETPTRPVPTPAGTVSPGQARLQSPPRFALSGPTPWTTSCFSRARLGIGHRCHPESEGHSAPPPCPPSVCLSVLFICLSGRPSVCSSVRLSL